MLKIFLATLIFCSSVLFSQSTISKIDQVLFDEQVGTNLDQIYVPISQLSSTDVMQKSSKSPWLAFILSAMLPGAGQLYNGDYVKAIIQPALFVGGALLASSICFDCSSIDQSAAGVGLGIAALSYLWSIIDAPISASAKNNTNLTNQLYETNLTRRNITDGPQQSTILNIQINF